MTKTDPRHFWLWLDPRMAGYQPGQDLGPYLKRGVELFRKKERWGGQGPAVVKAHPDLVRDGLEPAAEALGLAVIKDPRVPAGTFWLGLATGKKKGGGGEGV